MPVDDLPSPIMEARRGSYRRIAVVGEDLLHRPAREVTAFGTPQLRSLIDDLFATLVVAQGVGLAANQIGLDARVFVYDCVDASGIRHVGHLINPVLEPMQTTHRLQWHTEGCLSVPGPTADVAREAGVMVRGRDLMGKPTSIDGTGALGRCLQHLTDHLRGVLYLDQLAGRERHRVLCEMEAAKGRVWAAWQERAALLGTRVQLGQDQRQGRGYPVARPSMVRIPPGPR